ncbi:MAG: hypothetical protein ACYDA6_07140, partial [Solirubrobacteraceae bacterium]
QLDRYRSQLRERDQFARTAMRYERLSSLGVARALLALRRNRPARVLARPLRPMYRALRNRLSA